MIPDHQTVTARVQVQLSTRADRVVFRPEGRDPHDAKQSKARSPGSA